ncbi:MAG: isoleucine--tRNA ligase [Oscillospiraceae bacterium]|nr:isoleucine--tRNA ligase [Oscillospiraceae bacterium]
MYQKVSAKLDFAAREKDTLAFWQENKIFEKSIEKRKSAPPYVFYDGPPTANGMPHIGHVITRVFKDMIPRYRTMKGYMVPRKAGWDTHGLPVELEVEKLLGLDGKEQIEEYGLEPFIAKCKESVWKYKGLWEDFSEIVGFWADMDDPYVTYHNEFIESVWWSLKQIWDKGLLYKGFKIVPFCPRCETPLSSHEVAQGYKDVKERSAIVRFKLKDEDAYILAWTTTPWTLPSNVALCVNPDENYVKIKTGAHVYYLAEALVPSVIEDEYEVIANFKGRELEHKEYQPLFNFVNPDEKCWFVTCGEFVTLSDGTGVVHIAPAFGEDDANIGRKYGLPFVQLVNTRGEMTAETDWAGTFCKDADRLIIKALEEKGLLLSAPNYEHSYPHCWRCSAPLIYYARDSWFIKMTAVREKLISNNNTINWIPENIGKRRFGDWLENVQDWGISRNRYWGTPLNIWECECSHLHSVGSVEELKSMSDNCPDNIELHRPFIDAVTIKCEKCGGEMKRVPEVIDCWYDSGAMPFAQHHYPFENKELFESEFPADFICEAVDQTRGWFYSLLAISTLIFDKAPYKNVIVLGHVQDKDGQKMSKTKGNAIDPFDALTTYGADAVRWYFYTNSAPWLPSRFHGKAVIEGQRKFMGTLLNTYAFYVLYAEIDQFDPHKYAAIDCSQIGMMDKWLLSRLHSMIKAVDINLENYKVPEAARALENFVDELSNWYVRRCRERYWASGMEQDKINAYLVLHNALVWTAKAAAPMLPFMAEDIYQNLVRSFKDEAHPESVHLCGFPVYDDDMVDAVLEKKMDAVLKIVTLGRAARNAAGVKNRQPLSVIYISAGAELDGECAGIVKDELNIKNIIFTDDTSGFVSYSFKPQLKTLGPKYGKQLGEIREKLANLDGTKAKAELDSSNSLKLSLSGGEAQLSEEDLLIETVQKEGFHSLTENGVTVVIDINLTKELIEEGFVREIISKIQTMRKEADFNVTDNINIYAAGSEKVIDIMRSNAAVIQSETLALNIELGTVQGFAKEWDINGEKADFGVERV